MPTKQLRMCKRNHDENVKKPCHAHNTVNQGAIHRIPSDPRLNSAQTLIRTDAPNKESKDKVPTINMGDSTDNTIVTADKITNVQDKEHCLLNRLAIKGKILPQEQNDPQNSKLTNIQLTDTHLVPSFEFFTQKITKPVTFPTTNKEARHMKEILKPKNIAVACPTFDPDQGANRDFNNFWNRILYYTKSNKLTEQSYIDILNMQVKGSAARTLSELIESAKPLSYIIDTLNDLYTQKDTILMDCEKLRDFSRKSNEEICLTMSRAKILIERLRRRYHPTIWEQTKRREIQLSILKQVVTPNTINHIHRVEQESWKSGDHMSYTSVLNEVENFELSYAEKPQYDINLKIDPCSGTIINPKDTIIESNLYSQNNLLKDLAKVFLQTENTRMRKAVLTIRREIAPKHTNAPKEAKNNIYRMKKPRNGPQQYKNTVKNKTKECMKPSTRTQSGHYRNNNMHNSNTKRYNSHRYNSHQNEKFISRQNMSRPKTNYYKPRNNYCTRYGAYTIKLMPISTNQTMDSHNIQTRSVTRTLNRDSQPCVNSQHGGATPSRTQVPNFAPITPYVNINVSLPQNKGPEFKKKSITATALIDTGCSKTCISRKFYNALIKSYNNDEQLVQQTNRSMTACNAAIVPIYGITNIRLWMSTRVYRDITAIVLDTLPEPLVLGYEFLDSDYVKSLSKTHLIVTNLFNRRPIRIPIFKKIALKMPCLKKVTQMRNQIDKNEYNDRITKPRKSHYRKNHIKRPNIVNNIFVHTNRYEPLANTKSIRDDPNTKVKHVNHYKAMSKNYRKIKKLSKIGQYYDPSHRTLVYIDNDSFESDDSFYPNSLNSQVKNYTKKKPKIQKINKSRTKSNHKLNDSNASSYTLEYIDRMKMNGDSEQMDYEPPASIEKQPRKTKVHAIAQSTKDNNDIETNETGYTELGLVNDTPVSETEFLKLFDLKHLDPNIQTKLHSMFLQNKEIFATHKWDIGKTKVLEMDIDLKTDEERTQTYIRIPDNIKTQVQEILDQLIKYDIIRVCNEPSQFTSNILVTRKKDGSIRLLFDGRLLNHETKQVAMASITKPEIISHIAGKKHLSSLDFADAFFHIPLSKKAQPLTTFYAYGQRLCFTRAPQGLKNSPSYLKSLLDITFYDMTDSILFYADDLLIATDGTLDEHFDVLKKVLMRLKNAGLKLRPQKMLIVKQNIEFLGLVFNKDSINIPTAKLESFKAMQSPKTPKKCKSIIACLSFYRNFLPHFAELSREIMELSTLEQKQFKWTNSHEEKLRYLIEQMCKNKTLYLPLHEKPFFITASSTDMSASGTLSQLDSKGNHKIICATSRTFTKTERNYSKSKKNILALVYTLKSNDYFIKYATNLIVRIDTRSLIHLKLAKESSGILLRLSLEIMKYNFKIMHSENPNLITRTNEIHMSKEETRNLIDRIITTKDLYLTSEEDKLISQQKVHYPKKTINHEP